MYLGLASRFIYPVNSFSVFSVWTFSPFPLFSQFTMFIARATMKTIFLSQSKCLNKKVQMLDLQDFTFHLVRWEGSGLVLSLRQSVVPRSSPCICAQFCRLFFQTDFLVQAKWKKRNTLFGCTWRSLRTFSHKTLWIQSSLQLPSPHFPLLFCVFLEYLYCVQERKCRFVLHSTPAPDRIMEISCFCQLSQS